MAEPDFVMEIRFPDLPEDVDEPNAELWVCCEFCAWAENVGKSSSPAEIETAARSHRCGGQDEARSARLDASVEVVQVKMPTALYAALVREAAERGMTFRAVVEERLRAPAASTREP